MNRSLMKFSVLSVAVSLFMSGSYAFADTIEGRIASSRSTGVELTVFDAQGRPYPNNLKLKVDNFTRLNNFPSMSGLKKQDLVRVDVKQGRDGAWHADSLTKLANRASVPLAPVKPTPNLMDALRSPQAQTTIKRGLTGAIVGGVASSASGGKAGKGALIGAGAGIIGGWLSDALTAPRQTSSTAGSQASVSSDPNSYNG